MEGARYTEISVASLGPDGATAYVARIFCVLHPRCRSCKTCSVVHVSFWQPVHMAGNMGDHSQIGVTPMALRFAVELCYPWTKLKLHS